MKTTENAEYERYSQFANEQFKEAYYEALEQEQESFEFDGAIFYTQFAKYLIEYFKL